MRQILPLLVTFLVIFLTSRRGAGKKAAAARPVRAPAPEEDERTRQVREAVQRKIRERQAASVRPLVVEPPPVQAEEPEVPSDAQAAAVLAAQQRLQDQIRTLERDEANTGRVGRVVPNPPEERVETTRSTLDDLRRAMIWREILSPPIALRGPGP
jgi:hypothetical protein